MAPISAEVLDREGKRADVRKYAVFQERVLKYLRDHPEQAFTQGEVAKVMSTSEQQARLTLMSLVRKGVVGRFEHPNKVAYELANGGKVERTFYSIVYKAE